MVLKVNQVEGTVICELCNGIGLTLPPKNNNLVYLCTHSEDIERTMVCKTLDELKSLIDDYEYDMPNKVMKIEIRTMTEKEYNELTEVESE